MKVIAGTLKNREITIPSSCLLRPTSAKLRGQVFNICQGIIEGAEVLDLFAGSGAIGIEALSRGAGHATFVEHNPKLVEALRKNLEHFGLSHRATVLSMDVCRASALPSRKGGEPFACVYIDPPYTMVDKKSCQERALFFSELLLLVANISSLSPGAVLFLETRRGAMQEAALPLSLPLVSRRSSGSSELWEMAVGARTAQEVAAGFPHS